MSRRCQRLAVIWLSKSKPGLVLGTSFLAFSLLYLCFGAEPLSWTELTRPGTPAYRILTELRLPRLILVLWIGGSLAVLGSTYQTLFHNPLAEPYVLGVSSAVTLGIAASEILFGLPSYSWKGLGYGMAAAGIATFLLLSLCWARSEDENHRLLLFGMGLNFVLSSALFLLLSYHAQQMGGGSLKWIFGQIPYLSKKEILAFVAITAPLLMTILILGRSLDALSLGDSVARTLGVSPKATRTALLFITCLYVSFIVGFSGAVGFVGLVVPHAIRLMLYPPTNRKLLLWAFGWGAVFLLISDFFSKVILPPFEFPIGIITTLIGGPIFLVLLWKR